MAQNICLSEGKMTYSKVLKRKYELKYLWLTEKRDGTVAREELEEEDLYVAEKEWYKSKGVVARKN